MKSSPILILPTHRSYVDFLLVSYLFFGYDLRLPIIAAGEDFKAMYLVSWFLRSSGAFFIRRQFGNDSLYWVLFSEYLHTQITNSDYPIEFFIEGTRSRTGKSLHPKVGMLRTVAEPFFDHSVSDISIFPISITYQKRLEYNLYSKELSGIKGKPKESTKGLLKARSVMQHNFGAIHVYIAPSISLKKYAALHKWDRKANVVAPPCVNRHMLSSQKQKLALKLAYDVIKAQQKGLVVFLNVIVAAVLLQHPLTGVSLAHLISLVREMILQVKMRNGKVVLYSQQGSDFAPVGDNSGGSVQSSFNKEEARNLDLFIRVAVLQSIGIIKELVVIPQEVSKAVDKSCEQKMCASLSNTDSDSRDYEHVLIPSLDGSLIFPKTAFHVENSIALAHMRNQVRSLFPSHVFICRHSLIASSSRCCICLAWKVLCFYRFLAYTHLQKALCLLSLPLY